MSEGTGALRWKNLFAAQTPRRGEGGEVGTRGRKSPKKNLRATKKKKRDKVWPQGMGLSCGKLRASLSGAVNCSFLLLQKTPRYRRGVARAKGDHFQKKHGHEPGTSRSVSAEGNGERNVDLFCSHFLE